VGFKKGAREKEENLCSRGVVCCGTCIYVFRHGLVGFLLEHLINIVTIVEIIQYILFSRV